MNVTKKKKTKNYLNNKDMLKEWKTSAEKNAMTDTFARMIMLLTKRYSSKVRFNVCDTFREDMESYALMTVSKVWKSFNPKKSDNTFAYFTQVIKRAFYQYQNMERVHRNISNELQIYSGNSPSHAYMVEYEYRNIDMNDLGGDINTITYQEELESVD
jgi:DNA-directed RNA polymerase specialized sigma subunit